MLCAPRQIAAVLKRDFGEVCSQMDDVEQRVYATGDWRERGCTARMIIEYARDGGHGACVLHEDRVVSTLPGPNPSSAPSMRTIATFTPARRRAECS